MLTCWEALFTLCLQVRVCVTAVMLFMQVWCSPKGWYEVTCLAQDTRQGFATPGPGLDFTNDLWHVTPLFHLFHWLFWVSSYHKLLGVEAISYRFLHSAHPWLPIHLDPGLSPVCVSTTWCHDHGTTADIHRCLKNLPGLAAQLALPWPYLCRGMVDTTLPQYERGNIPVPAHPVLLGAQREFHWD